MTSTSSRRLVVAVLSATALVGGAFALPTSGPGAHFSFTYAAQLRDPVQRAQLLAKLEAVPHTDSVTHNHNDPATKNALSRAADHSGGMIAPPTSATMLPTIAHVVSRSPRPDTVAQSASSKSCRWRAAHQSAKGMVSWEMTRVPLPSAETAVRTS